MTQRIAILICTHDRPDFLRKLLERLRSEDRPGIFLTVIDNGSQPADAVIEPFRSEIKIFYKRVREPGLVVARNASIGLALRHAPEILTFIDDDEVPSRGWLEHLLRPIWEGHADIVTGPIEAEFLTPPPAWAIRGNYFSHDGQSYRTSNLAIRTSIFPSDPGQWFKHEFNEIGGEDEELLARLVAGGARHAVATDAVVAEFVPAARLRRRYIWRCGRRDGVIIAEAIFARSGTTGKAYGACMLEAGKKLSYAANHLFWALRSPWRANNAIADLNAVAGIFLRMAGIRPTYYGSRRFSDVS